jgi:phosphatidylinositol alpha-1,6-mannosyltransferase
MTAMLVTETFPPRIGGTARWFWELYRRMPRDDVIVAAGTCEGDAAFDRTHDLRVERMPLAIDRFDPASPRGWITYARTVLALRRLRRGAAAGRLDCGRVLPEGWLALSCGVPFVCYVHGEELVSNRSSRLYTRITRRVLERAALVIANSHHTAALVEHDWQADPARIAILWPGVDTARFAPAPPDERVRAELGWDGRLVVLTVGRLQKRKGHDRMLEAVDMLRGRYPRLLYAIIGDGQERPALERQVQRANLGNHVQFHGAVDDDRLVPALQQCELFALPNRTVDGDLEGFGMVLIEAQACGRPVLAGASGGTAEAVRAGETGVIVDCTLAEPLADALAVLLDDPAQRTRMGRAARHFAVETFDFDRNAERVAAALGRVKRKA